MEGREVTYAPISGMASGKYFWKNSITSSPEVIFSNSSNGMKSVQVNVLSWNEGSKLVHNGVTTISQVCFS